MKEFIYFALGIAVSIPIGVFSPLGTTRVQARIALRNEKRASARFKYLSSHYKEVDQYHQEPQRFMIFLILRLLLINMLWIGQEAVDFFIGLLSNGTSDVVWLAGKVTYDAGPLTTLISTAGSLIGIILLSLVFRICLRAWRISRHVTHYDEYTIEIQVELASIRQAFPNIGTVS